MNQPMPPPSWHADPSGSGHLRWWDGRQWTQYTHPATGAADQSDGFARFEGNVDGRGMDAERVRAQAQQGRGATGTLAGGGGTIFTEPTLIVNQRAKLMEASSQYKVFDQHGQPIGAVVQTGQSGFGKAVRMLTRYDALMPVRLEVHDTAGPQFVVHKPVSLWKSRIQVTTPDETAIGEIAQENVWGKLRFTFLAGGRKVGHLAAENLRGWDYRITDALGTELARVNKQYAGLAKTLFTEADNYAVRIHQPLQGPMAALVLGSALTIDQVCHQQR